MEQKTHIKPGRRYYLHRKVKEVARLFAANKTGIIYVPFNEFEFGKHQKYIDALVAIGYSVQTEII